MTTDMFAASTELKKRYLERKFKEFDSYDPTQVDLPWAQQMGHQIKGNAATFDFPALEPLGAQLEIAAKNNEVEVVLRLLSAIKLECLRYQSEIDKS